MKPFYFLSSLLVILTVGCSFVPIQKAGSEALAEAICLYDEKIDKESTKFNECLADQAR